LHINTRTITTTKNYADYYYLLTFNQIEKHEEMNTTDDNKEVDGEQELQQYSEYIQQKLIDEHDA